MPPFKMSVKARILGLLRKPSKSGESSSQPPSVRSSPSGVSVLHPAGSRAGSVADGADGLSTSTSALNPPATPQEPPPTPAATVLDSAQTRRQSGTSVSSSHHATAVGLDNPLVATQATIPPAPSHSAAIAIEPTPTATAASAAPHSAIPPTAPAASATHHSSTSLAAEEVRPSLWHQALHSEKLSAEERRILSEASGEEHVRQITASIGDTVTEIEKQKQGMEWKIPFCGDVIVMNDIAMKILRWVHKFNEIGDIIVQYDPGHTALPWAALRFLLKVNMSSQPYERLQKTDDNLRRSAWTSQACRTPS